MATATLEAPTQTPVQTHVEQIGDTAGLIWHTLSEDGPTSITKLIKKVGAPRDLVMQGIGWLAREEKIVIEEESRSRIISLSDE
ncbi:MAG: winged helix-turn-helix domain-containing protein [Planctomycetes bacterium]|nr:winged helix-turn-helix domain-containing protein [Planctomycetota bacterium]